MYNGLKKCICAAFFMEVMQQTGLVTTMSFWVGSTLDCRLYKWRLFVYFKFPSIRLDLRILLSNQIEGNVT